MLPDGFDKSKLQYGAFDKVLINLAVSGPQEFFKQHLIKNEEQPSFSKRCSAHFGAVSTT